MVINVFILMILISFLEELSTRDPASNQLLQYHRENGYENNTILSSYGTRSDDIDSTLRVGKHGPILIQDTTFFDIFGHFDRERIPERVVHAKGAGAFGYFVVTDDITLYTKAIVFEKVGKKTKVAVRFSTVIGESGTPDTRRDPRGFAIKFYTEDGIWDLVGNNTPIFFVRDPLKFPLFIHSQKRNPVTHLWDRDMFWDYVALQPETLHQMMRLFSDLGTPDGYRHMNGYGSHTFKMVNNEDNAIYVKFHFLTDQGIKNLTASDAAILMAKEPNYATRDLYNAIALGKFPSWTLYIQLMTFKQAKTFRWDPFDVTKMWPEEEYPLKKVGKLILNKNPSNYFTDVEQLAFNPGNMISGIEASPDIMLQGRMFSYGDTHRYRLGANYQQLSVNTPLITKEITNYQRDGPHAIHNQDGAPTYFPNSFGGPKPEPKAKISTFHAAGDVEKYSTRDDDNFSQCTMFWNRLNEGERERLIENIVGHLKDAAPFIQEQITDLFTQVSKELGTRLRDGLFAAKTKKPNKVCFEL